MAAGVALVLAVQGRVSTIEGTPTVFNLPDPLLKGLVAVSKKGQDRLRPHLTKNGASREWEAFFEGVCESHRGARIHSHAPLTQISAGTSQNTPLLESNRMTSFAAPCCSPCCNGSFL